MPNIRMDDTIAAIATAPGEAAMAVIRLSGPSALSIADQVFRTRKGYSLQEAASHTLHLGRVFDESGRVLDEAVAGIFKAPHSYTGEDIVEFSTHGGLRVTRSVLDLLIRKGARHAEPGEFTKRAFLAGKIDLTQAEAVLDLIRAKSGRSLEAALGQLSGGLSHRFKCLKDDLMKIYAHMEAFLDFPDEHLEVYSDPALLQMLARAQREMTQLLDGFKRGALLREGALAVIVGKPNVGKSSLFNALLERDRALVSDFPGTTRDVLEEAVEIGGFYIRLADTAGLSREKGGHPLDKLAMERTRRALEAADLFLYVVDGSAPLEDEDRAVFHQLPAGKPLIAVIHKSDLAAKISREALEEMTGSVDTVRLSSLRREGFDELEHKVADTLGGGVIEKESQQITRLRHKNALEKAVEAVERAQASLQEGRSLEFVVLDLKAALEELRELVGEIYSENLLDVVFSEFCIGK